MKSFAKYKYYIVERLFPLFDPWFSAFKEVLQVFFPQRITFRLIKRKPPNGVDSFV